MRTLKVFILACDEPAPEVYKQRGSYVDIFTRNLEAAGKRQGYTIKTGSLYAVDDCNDADSVNCYPADEEIGEWDAYLLTGSRHTSYHDDPWIIRLCEFVKKVLLSPQCKSKVIGICFGHQIVARALGGRVEQANSWEVSYSQIDLTEQGQKIFGQTQLEINQMHRDVVSCAPEQCMVIASNKAVSIQGMLWPGRALTLQGKYMYSY